MTQRTPTEHFTRYATNVDSLPDAWEFVMGHVDSFQRPSITITPISAMDGLPRIDEPEHWEHYYEVAVSGDVDVSEQ